MSEDQDVTRDLTRIFDELMNPQRTAPLMGSTNRDAASALLALYERRALDLDGAEAPRGLDAVQLKYHPTELGNPPTEAGLRNLRRTIGVQLGLQ